MGPRCWLLGATGTVPRMARIFFSHAHEDAAAVDLIYKAVVERYPEHLPWLDKYEIVGGDDLVERIASGMDASAKFFIFLSRAAAAKPWVDRELKRALMREINGPDPDFIVPVKLGDLDSIPAFLEHKYYIDLSRLPQEEWLAAFNASITGMPQGPQAGSSNVQPRVDVDPAEPNVAMVWFEALGWAQPFRFGVRTRSDIIDASTTTAPIGGIADNAFVGAREVREARLFGQWIGAPLLRPGTPMAIRLVFASGVDARTAIESVDALD